jgi:hypothetical protein
VALPALDNADTVRTAFRAAHNIPADAPLLLFVGRLHAVKRPRETIEAFCRAAPPRSHLVLAGIKIVVRKKIKNTAKLNTKKI